jgi:hypothetical protein
MPPIGAKLRCSACGDVWAFGQRRPRRPPPWWLRYCKTEQRQRKQLSLFDRSA